jgi:hypothetical protein
MRKKRFGVEQTIGVEATHRQVSRLRRRSVRPESVSRRSTVGRRSMPAWRWTKFERWSSYKRKIYG